MSPIASEATICGSPPAAPRPAPWARWAAIWFSTSEEARARFIIAGDSGGGESRRRPGGGATSVVFSAICSLRIKDQKKKPRGHPHVRPGASVLSFGEPDQ